MALVCPGGKKRVDRYLISFFKYSIHPPMKEFAPDSLGSGNGPEVAHKLPDVLLLCVIKMKHQLVLECQ